MLVGSVDDRGPQHARPDEAVARQLLGEEDRRLEDVSPDDVEEGDHETDAHEDEAEDVGRLLDGIQDLFHVSTLPAWAEKPRDGQPAPSRGRVTRRETLTSPP